MCQSYVRYAVWTKRWNKPLRPALRSLQPLEWGRTKSKGWRVIANRDKDSTRREQDTMSTEEASLLNFVIRKGVFNFFRTTLKASLVAQMVKRLPTMQETWVQSLDWEDLLEKEMATHSSTLAWRIPRMEEPGRLQSMGSQRVRHDWATSLSFTIISWAYWYFIHFLVVVNSLFKAFACLGQPMLGCLPHMCQIYALKKIFPSLCLIF